MSIYIRDNTPCRPPSSKPCFGVSERENLEEPPRKWPSKMALFKLVLNWLKWRKMGPKPPHSPFKVALCKLRYKNHHFTLLTPCFWTPIFDLQNKNVDLQCPNRWTSKQAPKTLKRTCKNPFKFLLKSVHLPLLTTLHALPKDDYDSMLFGGHLRPFSGFKETVDLYPLF